MKTSLAQQIEEIDRELALRKGVYQHQVASGKMRQSVADFHMDRMRAVKDTLAWMAEHEGEIRAWVESRKGEAA